MAGLRRKGALFYPPPPKEGLAGVPLLAAMRSESPYSGSMGTLGLGAPAFLPWTHRGLCRGAQLPYPYAKKVSFPSTTLLPSLGEEALSPCAPLLTWVSNERP